MVLFLWTCCIFRFLFGYNCTMDNLTKKQKEVLDFIKIHIDKQGFFPTIDQIRKALQLNAVSTIHGLVTIGNTVAVNTALSSDN